MNVRDPMAYLFIKRKKNTIDIQTCGELDYKDCTRIPPIGVLNSPSI